MEIFKLPKLDSCKIHMRFWDDLLLSLAVGIQQMCMAINIAIDGKLM